MNFDSLHNNYFKDEFSNIFSEHIFIEKLFRTFATALKIQISLQRIPLKLCPVRLDERAFKRKSILL